MKNVILILVAAVVFSGCASIYTPIAPSTLIYNAEQSADSIAFGYRYDVLSFRGNKKYAKREPKNLVRVVALKIENNSPETLKLGENFFIYAGPNVVQPMEPAMVHKQLKQGVAIYLLYSLIWLNRTECQGDDCQTKAIIPIGVPITIGNMIAAGSSNKRFHEELIQYDLNTKAIEPGKTVYALIGVPDTGFQPLKLVKK